MDDTGRHKLQIFKFEMYGFLKNLRFFEPYLYVFLLDYISLFHIGILIAIREIIVYIFEIPSGVIADRYGKKTELVFCFVFYIFSFIIFFLAKSFGFFVIAMILFGLGEAFRSGTHKSMIMAYLDTNNIGAKKSKIYGLTRSFSLLGSMAMSLVAIVFVLWIPELKYLFIFSIIPYLIDLLMILTYPDYLNKRQDAKFNLKEFLRHNYESIKYAIGDRKVNRLVLNSSAYQAGFKSIQDYIQPLIISISFGTVLITQLSADENSKVYIGLVYAVIYLISSFASKWAHLFQERFESRFFVNLMWLLSGAAILILSFFLNNIFIIFFAFVVLYILLNIRRPIMVDLIGEATVPEKRASVLSVESQTKSLLLVIFAPLIGYIADRDIRLMFILVGIMMVAIFIWTNLSKGRKLNSQ